jgi:6-pyruvoyl-tetrahydropterin synthase
MLVAHSLRGEVFGPAQRLHGATYVVDVELRRGELHYRNLDDEPAFAGLNTTTEYLARVIFDRMAARLEAGTLGAEAAGIESIKVTLRESPVAWAAYEGQVGRAASVSEPGRGR